MRTYNKYRNKPTFVDGKRFASKKEAHRYQELIILQKQKIISELKCQPKFELLPKFTKNGITYRAINYIADFCYFSGKQLVVEDVKGYRKDKVFLLKQKLFEYRYPSLTLRIVK